MMFVPDVASVGALLVIESSATGRTVVVIIALVFLVGFESSLALSVATLVMLPPSSGALTVCVIVATASLASEPPVHRAVLVVSVIQSGVKLVSLPLPPVAVAPTG